MRVVADIIVRRILLRLLQEFLLIDEKTEIPAFSNEIRWNELVFGLRQP